MIADILGIYYLCLLCTEVTMHVHVNAHILFVRFYTRHWLWYISASFRSYGCVYIQQYSAVYCYLVVIVYNFVCSYAVTCCLAVLVHVKNKLHKVIQWQLHW